MRTNCFAPIQSYRENNNWIKIKSNHRISHDNHNLSPMSSARAAEVSCYVDRKNSHPTRPICSGIVGEGWTGTDDSFCGAMKYEQTSLDVATTTRR